MKSIWIAAVSLLFVATIGLPMAEATSPPVHPLPQIVGGWRLVPDDAKIRAAARFAVRQMNLPGARLRTVNKAQSQVVAGTNFQIDITLNDRSRWSVIVWQRLDGGLELVSASKLRRARRN